MESDDSVSSFSVSPSESDFERDFGDTFVEVDLYIEKPPQSPTQRAENKGHSRNIERDRPSAPSPTYLERKRNYRLQKSLKRSGWVPTPEESDREKGWKRFSIPPMEEEKSTVKQTAENTPSHYRGDSRHSEESEAESEEFNDEDLELHLEQRKSKKRRDGTNSPSHQALDPAVEEAKRLIHVLSKNRKVVWPFEDPVDPIALHIPDYPLIVKRPMDLDTILRRLRDGLYVDRIKDYVKDVRLVFTNAVLYNEPTSPIYCLAVECSNVFEKKLDKSKTIIPPLPLGLSRSPRWKRRIAWRRAKIEEVICWRTNTHPKLRSLARNFLKDR